jgi:hypothetical protein
MLCITFLVSAQEKTPHKNKVPQRQNNVLFSNPNAYPFIKNVPGTYKLRQDNMPCIVPDTKDIAAIPNAWSSTVSLYRGNMPNGGRPRIRYKGSKK